MLPISLATCLLACLLLSFSNANRNLAFKSVFANKHTCSWETEAGRSKTPDATCALGGGGALAEGVSPQGGGGEVDLREYVVALSVVCRPARTLAPGKNTGVGCHFLLQGLFPTQGSNPGLPHSRQTL